jgi:hypothetical protein
MLHNRIFTSNVICVAIGTRGSILFPVVTLELFHSCSAIRIRPDPDPGRWRAKRFPVCDALLRHCRRRFDVRGNEIAAVLRSAIFDVYRPPAAELAAGAGNTIAGGRRVEPSRKSRCRGCGVSSKRGRDDHRAKMLGQTAFPPWHRWNPSTIIGRAITPSFPNRYQPKKTSLVD